MSKLGLKILKMVGLISIVSMSLLIATYLLVFQTLFNNLKAEAQKDIKAAISVIDGDKLEKIIQENSMDSPEYNEVYESMMKFKSDKNIKYFYTLVKKGDNKTAFAVDAAITEQAQIGDEYDLTPEIAKAFDGSINYTEKPYTDEYGTVLSAYAPIKNSKGSIIAVAAVDKDVAIFQTIKDSLFKSFIVLIVVNILLSLAISFIFSRRVTNDIKKINGDLNRMALGDLTGDLKINSRDEIQSIADSINNFRLKTSQTVAIVKDSCDKVSSQAESLSALSEEMTSASNEVASTIHSVSIVANNQAEELINVDKSVSTFSSKIETSSNSIEKLNRTIEEVETKAKISSNELFNLENSIRDINMLFEQVGINIKDLSTDIVRISEITNLINSIADQTNLLALNAAIEAARAGEQGRGFSVVADEIRKLAEQSKESSLNINNLLQGISDKNDLVITTADHVNNEFKGQLGTINHSINSFKEIVASIEDVLPAINTINLIMKQINSERSDIVAKVDKTASLAQDISASSEVILSSSEELSASTQEVASAALNLNQMTENMNRAVNYFKV